MFPHQAIGIVHYDLPNGGTARVRHVWVGMVGRKSTETCNVKIKSCKKYCVSVVLVCPIEFLQLKQLSFGSNKEINWMFTRIPSLSQWTLADSFTISSLTWGVGWSVEKGLEQLHVFDVVNINGLFKAHHESLKNTQHAMLQQPCLKGKASKRVCDSKPWHSACVASWALTWSYMMTVKKKRIAQNQTFGFIFYDWLLSCFILFGKVHLMVREPWPAVSGKNAPQRPALQGGWPGLPVCWAWQRGCCWGNCSCRSPSPSWNGRCSCAAA